MVTDLRVLHCIASIDPSYGGPVEVVRGLAQELLPLGAQSTVLCASSGSAGRDAENASRFPFAEVRWLSPLWRRYYWSPLMTHTIKKELKNFDLLHVHGVFNGVVSGAMKAARDNKLPYILEPFGTLSPYCLNKSRALKRAALALRERRNIQAASAIRFTSESERRGALVNFRIGDSFVAGHGLDWREYVTLPSPGLFRREVGLSADDTVLLFFGRFQPIKGLDIFLQAFLEWRRHSGVPAKAVFVGPDEGGYRVHLEHLARKMRGEQSVLFAGPRYGRSRLEVLVDADVVFLSSHHENFGISAVEGMACAKPVLISDNIDLSKNVVEHRLGETAPLTIAGMKEALDRLFAEKAGWPQMGERARQWARANCDWARTAKVVYGQYLKALRT